jgi:hypothetical protein
MSLVEIPFSKEMATAALEGRKICTTRREKKGEIGDEFLIDGVRFRIVDLYSAYLETVATAFFRLEGCESPDAFRALWHRLHRGHYTLEAVYWVHFFARCP